MLSFSLFNILFDWHFAYLETILSSILNNRRKTKRNKQIYRILRKWKQKVFWLNHGFYIICFVLFHFWELVSYIPKIVLKLLCSQWLQSFNPLASSCRMLELQVCTPISVYVVLETDPRTLYILGKFSENKATSYPLITVFS